MENLWSMLNAPISIGDYAVNVSIQAVLLRVVLPLGFVWVTYRMVRLVAMRLLVRAEVPEGARRTVITWIRRVYLVVFPLLTVAYVGGLMGAEIFALVSRVAGVLNEPFFESGGTRLSVVTILLLIPVFSVASWVAHLAKQAVESRFLARIGLDPARRFSIASLIRYVVLIVAMVIGLSVIGINLSSLAVVLGVLGIGVGFGLQNVVANFFAGIVIILTRPLKEGDRILVHDYEGTVYQIRMISTVITTVTNETIIVPNSELISQYIHNYSYEDLRIIVVNKVQVSYSSDPDRVEEVLRAVSQENPFRVEDSEPRVLFWSFDDSGITVSVGTWIRDAQERIFASSWMTREIWRAFRRNHIEIPFPQRDLHVKSMPAPTPAIIEGAS